MLRTHVFANVEAMEPDSSSLEIDAVAPDLSVNSISGLTGMQCKENVEPAKTGGGEPGYRLGN